MAQIDTPRVLTPRTRQARASTAVRQAQHRAWNRYDRPSRITGTVILSLFAAVVTVPVIGLASFTFRSPNGGMTLDHWRALFAGQGSFIVKELRAGLLNSLMLVAVTLLIAFVVIIPAIVLIEVRFPRLHQVMHTLMLLPMAVPAIILVVGLAPVFSVTTRIFGTNTWSLALAYGILAMPYIYTTLTAGLDGMHAQTLAQAAQSLGASWHRTLLTVLLPCLRRPLVTSTLITTAIVLGEFTISSLLNRVTLQTALIAVGKTDVFLSVIVTLLVLLTTFAALYVCGGIGRATAERNRTNHKETP